ncbi:sulfite exporter TauE/SafE family protein [Patescibacteria group bacterium]|nr:sulfite exporter TauE/SafE family protein [Patescibacteria group bacterium]
MKLRLEGTHCQSCKTLIETDIKALEGVRKVEVDFETGTCQIEFDEHKVAIKRIKKTIEKLGYKVQQASNKVEKNKKNYRNLVYFGLALILFVVASFLVQKLGWLEILSRLNEQNLSYALIFFIGVLASFHCIGMCGGLIVTYTATAKKSQESKVSFSKPHLQYNLGRVISYTVIGGILGGVGSFFGINPTFTGVVIIIAAVFMVLMGLSLVTNFSWLEKIKPKTPAFIAKFLYQNRHAKNPKGPFIVGLLNGFMPCGPLQAMQLYALTSGSIVSGALSMGIYALGTVPLLFGFGSVISLIKNAYLKNIMKFSGIVVIILGLIMFNRGLINFGYGFGSFVPGQQASSKEEVVNGEVDEYQVVNMELSYGGYSPNVLSIKKGIPVRWVIDAKQVSGCTNEIIVPSYNIKQELKQGENIIEFTPTEAGEIKFSCWMQMVWGKFIVIENKEISDANGLDQEEIESETSSSCDEAESCGGACGATSCGCSQQIGVE